jgi:hypothetical protein
VALDSKRAMQLRNIADSIPDANRKVAQQTADASQLQMFRTIGQDPQKAAAPGVAGQLAAQKIQTEAQATLAQRQKAATARGQIGKEALTEQSVGAKERLTEKKIALKTKSRQLASQLGRLDTKVKNQLLDDNMKFETDELGRTLFNLDNLLDFKLTVATDENELKDAIQKVEQLSRKRDKMLEISLRKIKMEQSHIQKKALTAENQAMIKRLKLAEHYLTMKAERERSRKKNRGAKAAAVMSVMGSAAGASTGTPQGAQAGGAMGGGLSGLIDTEGLG